MYHPFSSDQPLWGRNDQLGIAWLPESVHRWQSLILTNAEKYQVDPELLAIIITIESGGNPQAVSQVGAQGLMQIMPGTAGDIAKKYLKEPRTDYDIYDPATNIEFGAAYLSYLRDRFGTAGQSPTWDETVELVAAGYNGGPGAARRLQDGEGLTSAETVSYSRDALGLWRERHAGSSPTYERWLDRGGKRLIDSAT